MQWVTNQFPTVISGQQFTLDLVVNNSVGNVNFSIQSGSLPNGITISNAQVIGNNPDAKGRGDVTIRATDSIGSVDQAFVWYAIPLLDTSKGIFCISGDSLVANTLNTLNPNIDSIGAYLSDIFGGQINVVEFGFPGHQINGVASKYNSTAALINPSNFPFAAKAYQGGANDLQINSPIYGGDFSLTASQLSGRFQAPLQNAKNNGWDFTILSTILAWGGNGSAGPSGNPNLQEQLRLDANTNLRSSGYADVVADVGGLSIFNSLTATLDRAYYGSDRVHLEKEGNRKFAQEIGIKWGVKNNLPLLAVFDVDRIIGVGATFRPKNIPFGGNQSDTKTYKWYLGNILVSQDFEPDLSSSIPGNIELRLEVETTTDGIKSQSKIITFYPAQNIGLGKITPAYSELVLNGNVDFLIENITSPIIELLQGNGVVSGSGNNRNYADGNLHQDALIIAYEPKWASVGAGSILANQDWDLTGYNGTPNGYLKPYLKKEGDRVIFKLPASITNAISTGSTISVQEAATGRQWQFRGGASQGFYDNPGTGVWTPRKTLAELGYSPTQNLKIEFRRVKIGVDHTYAIYIEDNFQFNFTVVKSNIDLQDTFGIYDEDHTLWKAPQFIGSGIENWNQGAMYVKMIAAPIAGFNIPSEIGAGEKLPITDLSQYGSIFQYFINGQLKENSSNPIPNLAKYFNSQNYEYTIIQKVINNYGESISQPKLVKVKPRFIRTGNVNNYQLSNLATHNVRLRIRAVDEAENKSLPSNFIIPS